MEPLLLHVPGISCEHCVTAISTHVGDVAGVTAVHVNLTTKTVRVDGNADTEEVRAAVDNAGYEVAP